MGMSPFAFLTLLASVHIVAGTMSPKSCPAGNKPAEMIAREIKSDEEAATIMLCDTVSVEKGNDIKNLRQVSTFVADIFQVHSCPVSTHLWKSAIR